MTLTSAGQLRALLDVAFTDEQLAAATAPLSPGLIVAGAGSGKTSVMAARVVWLVGTGQVPADRVLGLTFTNKAAGELAGRVRAALRAAGLLTDDAEPNVSTYHAFAGRLVAEHGLRLGVEPRSRLLADATRYQLAARVLRRHRGPIRSLTQGLPALVGQLVSLESELSEHLVDPVRLLAWDADWCARLEEEYQRLDGQKGLKGHCDDLRRLAAAARQRQELTRLAQDYRAAKRELDALDFGDHVALAARLAEEFPEVGLTERDAARVVLLDEYQDTSVAQRRMLTGLFAGPRSPGHPVTAVGDPSQAIYAWRGAAVANLERFPDHFPLATGGPAEVFSLAVNQRSGGRLLRLANTVAASLGSGGSVVTLQPPPGREDLGEVVVALHATWSEEVAWVASELVRRITGNTALPGGCAVLVRARRDFGDLYTALTGAGLPVEVVGLGGLLALPEVADVVAVLEVLDDPTANAALVRLLTGPRWRLGPRDLAQLGRVARDLLRDAAAAGQDSGGPGAGGETGETGETAAAGALEDRAERALRDAVSGVDPCDVVSLSDALDRPGRQGWSLPGLRRVTALNAELRELRRFRDEPLLDLVHRVVSVTGLDVELASSPVALAARRSAGLAAFLDVVAGFTDLDGDSSLTSFLGFLRAADEHERGLDTTSPVRGDAVQLLTVHKAKGLEWDVVACPDLTRKVFPAETGRDRWSTSGCVLPGPLRGDADDQPSLTGIAKAELAAFKDDCSAQQAREERRLAYVAFTRARHVLIGSGHHWGPTQKKPRGPSVFLEELRAHADAGHGVVDVWVDVHPEGGNPLLAERVDHVWPAPYEPAAYGLRRAAADAVLSSLAGAAADATDHSLTDAEQHLLAALDREGDWLLAEAREERRPVREVSLPAALTASQLLRLRADPDGLARDLARPLPRPPAPSARRGTRFHAWVETLFLQRPLLEPEDLPGAEDDGAADDEELAALQASFLQGPYGTSVPFAVEAPFALPLAGRVVRGRIDAVYQTPAGWEVVDWKTGHETADPLQLAVYRLAWARLRGVPLEAVSAAFVYVRTGEVRRPDGLLDEAGLTALLRDAPAAGAPAAGAPVPAASG